MTKDQCTAIINAIKESVDFIMTTGIAQRTKVSDPANDATYVNSLVTGYDTAIQAIITNIPDDNTP